MRALKIALAVLAGLVALAIVAAIVIASFFDPNDYKSVVTDAFEARTGRTLIIDSDLKLAFFPWLAVEAGKLTVGNAPGFGEGGAARPFATIERAAARVKVLPLLQSRVEIGTVELDGLQLELTRDAQLRGNWQDLSAAAEGAPEGASIGPVNPGAARVESFALEGIRIRNGTVHWRENGELLYTVSDLDVSTGALGGGEPVTLELGLKYRNELTGFGAELQAQTVAQVAPDGSLSLRDFDADATLAAGGGARAREISVTATTLVFDRPAQTLEATALTTEVAGLRTTWELHGATLLDNPTFAGKVIVADAPLAKIFEELEWSPPLGVDAGDLGNFSWSSAFSYRAEPREISLTDVDAQMFGMHVRGSGALAGADEIKGRIEIPEFAPNSAVQWLLRTSIPPTVDVSAIDKLALATRFDANMTTGRAALRDLKLSVFGATIDGELEAIPGERGNTFRGTVKTSRFAPDKFAKAFARMLSDRVDPAELGMVRIETRFVFDSAADSVTVAPFQAELFGLSGSGELVGRNLSSAAAWSGQAKIAQFAPQDLLRRFGLPPQPTSDPQAFTRASIDTHFEVDAKQSRFRDIVLALDDSKITGEFTVEGFDKPRYVFALAVDRVDADRYLPPKARDAQAGEATAGDIELPQNNTMRLDGTMQIGDLRLAGMRFADVASRIVIGDGNAKLEGARARLYGGDFSGNFTVHAAGNEPGLFLDGRASNLQLTPLIEALTGEPANFSGSGNFELDLAGNGRTVIQNVQSAAGKVNFAIRDGAVKGFNLGRTLCAAYNATQSAPPPRGEQPNATQYKVIQGTATVTAGTASSTDLIASTSFMDIMGHGTLGLVEQRLDYDFDAKLTGKIAIPGCETLDGQIGEQIPFVIRGTVTQPDIKPDFSKLVQRAIRERLQDRLEDRLRDRIRGNN